MDLLNDVMRAAAISRVDGAWFDGAADIKELLDEFDAAETARLRARTGDGGGTPLRPRRGSSPW